MKKMVICLFLIISLCFVHMVPFVVYAEEDKFVRVLLNYSFIFKVNEYPNDFDSLPEEGYYRVVYGDVLKLESENPVEDLTNENVKYFLVSIPEFGEGYIITTHVIPDEITSLDNTIEYNAEINKDEVAVYRLEGENYAQIENILLSSGDKVKLIDGYDMSKTYLRAMIVSNGNPIMVYIERENIVVKGVSLNVILAIFILVFCVAAGIIMAYFYFKKHIKHETSN